MGIDNGKGLKYFGLNENQLEELLRTLAEEKRLELSLSLPGAAPKDNK